MTWSSAPGRADRSDCAVGAVPYSGMATIVELVGIPGSGKSTVASRLVGRRVAGRAVVGTEGLLGHRSRVERLLRPARRTSASPDDALERWAVGREELLGFLADRPLGADVDDPTTVGARLRRLRAPAWLLTTLELHALAAEAPDDRLVVLHEGLLQRTGLVCGRRPDGSTITDFVTRAVAATPHVALVVSLACDPERATERIRARESATGAVNRRHVGLDDRALEQDLGAQATVLTEAVQAARRAGRRVLDVDTERSRPDETVDAVVAALEPAVRPG